jgi:hypothetical protein
MTKTLKKPTRKPADSQPQPVRRKPISLQLAGQLCPAPGQMEKIAQTFAIDPTEAAVIRSGVHELIAGLGRLLDGDLGERGLDIFMQRIVGCIVSSAAGAGQVYSNALSDAQGLTNSLLNDDRDADRTGPAGFDDRITRKCEYAALRAMQAHASFAAAEGAAAAYEEIIGSPWKPYSTDTAAGPQSVQRKALSAQIAAFG